MMLLVAAICSAGLLIAPAPAPDLFTQQSTNSLEDTISFSTRRPDLLRAPVSPAFPADSLTGAPTGTLIAEGGERVETFSAEELAAKEEAKKKGLAVLAFGILPSLWASSIGIPGAFEQKKKGLAV